MLEGFVDPPFFALEDFAGVSLADSLPVAVGGASEYWILLESAAAATGNDANASRANTDSA